MGRTKVTQVTRRRNITSRIARKTKAAGPAASPLSTKAAHRTDDIREAAIPRMALFGPILSTPQSLTIELENLRQKLYALHVMRERFREIEALLKRVR